jgi:hypothetical protein
MNLPADTAAILRAALNEAEQMNRRHRPANAFAILAEAVGNLLIPEPEPFRPNYFPACECSARHESECTCSFNQ